MNLNIEELERIKKLRTLMNNDEATEDETRAYCIQIETLLPQPSKTLYIDADSLIFYTAYAPENNIPTIEGDFIGNKIDKNLEAIFYSLVDDVVERCRVESLKGNMIRFKEHKLVFTPSKNFRYDIFPDYKIKRLDKEQSPDLVELKKLVKPKGLIVDGIEIHYDILNELPKVKKDYRGDNKHGYWNTPLYNAYDNMIKRCYRKDSKSLQYKEKKIKVYDKWLLDKVSFFNWCESNGYIEGLHIDRVDNNKHYIPSNLQIIQEADNKAKQNLTDNKRDYLTFDFKLKCYQLKQLGLSYREIHKELGITYDRKGKEFYKITKAISSFPKHITNEPDYIALHLSEGVRFMCGYLQYITKNNKGILYNSGIGIEADDICAYYARRGNPIASGDKDVIHGVFGNNYFYHSKHKKVVKTSKKDANRFMLLQCIMGDAGDDIPGIKGVGVKTAEKLLGDDHTFNRVIEVYKMYARCHGCDNDVLIEKIKDVYFDGEIMGICPKCKNDCTFYSLNRDDAILTRRLVGLDQWKGLIRNKVRLFEC